jgi:hypothetical protein
MNTSRKAVTLATFILLGFATAGLAYRSYAKEPEQIPAQLPLAIEIALSKPFYVPAATGTRVTKVVIRVPLVDDKNPDSVSAVKLEPKMEGDRVRVDVYALSGPTAGIITCKGWDALKTTKIESYIARLDEEVALTKLVDLGIRMGDQPLTFRVVPKRILSPVPDNSQLEGCECGSCAGLICCPNPGYCLGCGSCGSLCCSDSLRQANSN